MTWKVEPRSFGTFLLSIGTAPVAMLSPAATGHIIDTSAGIAAALNAFPRNHDLEAAVKAGVEMRKAQQAFFDAEDRNNRRHLLARSKEKEREFDRLAAKLLSPQGWLDL